MNNYIMPHALSDIKSLHVTYYGGMICHKVYELLMSILNTDSLFLIIENEFENDIMK
jgi:hypothetical protein